MPKSIGMKINCPLCHESIILDEVLTQQIEEEQKKKYESELKESEKKFSDELKKAKSALSENKKQMESLEESLNEKLKVELEKEKKKLQEEAKKRAEKSIGVDMKDLKIQLKERDKELEKSYKRELDGRKERRKFEDEKKNFELVMTRKLDDERKKIFEEATKKVVEEHELKNKEKQKQIEDLTNQISDWKRKAEQGSQKLQGEVLELEIEELLRRNFSNDNIEPISSGVGGADILQKVIFNNGKLCGTILIESKHANWSKVWVSKLKKDQRKIKADMGVIITTVLPKGIESFTFIDGIMIIPFKLAIPIISLLRNNLYEIARTKNINAGKDELKEKIYNYLTSIEFRQRVESVIESFVNIKDDLEKERRAMERIWSKREKQIEQAIYGIAGMYGGMQGIIKLPDIKSLNMPNLLLEQNYNSD